MRVLVAGRSDSRTLPGGDTVQLHRTADGLRGLGVTVDLSYGDIVDVASYDLVHIVTVTDDPALWKLGEQASEAGVPYTVSPIYASNSELLGIRAAWGRYRCIARVLGRQKTAWLRHRLWRHSRIYASTRRLLSSATVLLPNSNRERRQLLADFELPASLMCPTIYLGVDDLPESETPVTYPNLLEGQRGFALCVGRLEIRKNQLALLRASLREKFPVVLVGQANPREPRYVGECQRLIAKSGAIWIPQIPHEDMHPVYAAATVHVLPSWWETAGLATLEAGLAGCPVISTNRSPIDEYLGNLVMLCDPADDIGLGRLVKQKMAGPRNPVLREHILAHFTWERYAQETLAAYERVLG